MKNTMYNTIQASIVYCHAQIVYTFPGIVQSKWSAPF